MGAQLDANPLKYLLEQNDNAVMGAFGLDKNGDIFFVQSPIAVDFDKSELRGIINAVKYYADYSR